MYLGKLVKRNGKLTYPSGKDKLLYELFIDKIKDGQEVDIFVSVKGNKANNAQISKVHASIRMIAQELGYSFSDMKLIVKEYSGLCYEAEGEVVCISFADCSSQEISAAIEAANQIAEENGIILG